MVPVVGAPMAGGPSTVELARAVSGAGGLGVLAGANLTLEALAERVEQLRAGVGVGGLFGVNIFLPTAGPDPDDADLAAALAAHLAALDRWALRFGVTRGEARWDDDGWRAKVDWLVEHPVPVVTFHFGTPAREMVDSLHAVGTEVWTTVTSRAEAVGAAACGLNALIVQGREAGGHRGLFTNGADDSVDDEPGKRTLAAVLLTAAVVLLAVGLGACGVTELRWCAYRLRGGHSERRPHRRQVRRCPGGHHSRCRRPARGRPFTSPPPERATAGKSARGRRLQPQRRRTRAGRVSCMSTVRGARSP